MVLEWRLSEVEALDYWRLCDELSVIQAALLIVGEDPATSQDYISRWSAQDRPRGYDATLAALTHAILAVRLKATIRRGAWQRGYNEDPTEGESVGRDGSGRQIIYKDDPDWNLSVIVVEDLKTWLRGRGIKTGFFFPESHESLDYLDPTDLHYSPKLAAAISAWGAVSKDPLAMRGKTAKQALAIWLRRHADQYGLTKEDGTPNEQGIEEVSKIANWDTKGGAPRTPGE
jgi:hypothetical protein